MAVLGESNTNTVIARSQHTNIVKTLREAEVACFRHFPVGDELMRRGRVKYNQGGEGLQWPVRYKLHPTRGNDGTTPLTFEEHDQWLTASLQYRGLQCTDKITEKEMLVNRDSETRIVNVFGTMVSRMKDSMNDALKFLPYRDGSSASDLLPQGIETMLTATQTIDLDDNTDTQPSGNTASATDLVAYPNGTYAGLSTVLGAYGGTYRSTMTFTAPFMNWPLGRADTEYDFWTPLIGNYDSDTLPGTTHTWAGQATAAIRFLHDNLMRNSNSGADANLCVMERSMYTDLCTLQEGKERTMVTTAAPGAKQYGFGAEIFVDTLRCKSDYAITSRVAYIFNLDQLSVISMYPTLFKVNSEPDYDMASQSYRYAALALMNYRFESPARFGALKMLAT